MLNTGDGLFVENFGPIVLIHEYLGVEGNATNRLSWAEDFPALILVYLSPLDVFLDFYLCDLSCGQSGLGVVQRVAAY